MRLPPDSALSREQKEIVAAPVEGTMLVTGPPGSGKTVVAVFRERALRKQNKPVVSVAFNNVLTRYTGNAMTFHSWLKAWWMGATGATFPSEKIADATPKGWAMHWSYENAAELALGAWRPFILKGGHWGHLILDEAQDFPPSAHGLLCKVQWRVFGSLPAHERPSLCLLADENQRLTQMNATIAQMRTAHCFVEDSDVYALKRNYRNTRPIAEFAAHFYVGLPTGIPELPDAKGDLPRITVCDVDKAVERIATYARNHPDKQVGVLVQYNPTRAKVYNKLKHRLAERVQTYGTSPQEHSDHRSLRFDEPGRVTVLCYASAKGTEFDAVFLPELQTLRLADDSKDLARMNLYVMCSRAREHLEVLVDDSTRTHPVWALLPPTNLWKDGYA